MSGGGPLYQLPVYFDARRHASTQERRLRALARGGDDALAIRRTWYGIKLVGPEDAVLAALVELAGEFRLGRMQPRGSARASATG